MIFDFIKLYLSKLTAPKYKLTGRCKQCGRCCRNIVLFAYDKPIKDETLFEELKEQNKRLDSFYPSGKNDKGELLFTCKLILPNNKCKHYFFRPLYCKKYPMVKSLVTGKYLSPPKECGYRIELEKNFEDFIK